MPVGHRDRFYTREWKVLFSDAASDAAFGNVRFPMCRFCMCFFNVHVFIYLSFFLYKSMSLGRSMLGSINFSIIACLCNIADFRVEMRNSDIFVR